MSHLLTPTMRHNLLEIAIIKNKEIPPKIINTLCQASSSSVNKLATYLHIMTHQHTCSLLLDLAEKKKNPQNLAWYLDKNRRFCWYFHSDGRAFYKPLDVICNIYNNIYSNTISMCTWRFFFTYHGIWSFSCLS